MAKFTKEQVTSIKNNEKNRSLIPGTAAFKRRVETENRKKAPDVFNSKPPKDDTFD